MGFVWKYLAKLEALSSCTCGYDGPEIVVDSCVLIEMNSDGEKNHVQSAKSIQFPMACHSWCWGRFGCVRCCRRACVHRFQCWLESWVGVLGHM